MPAELQQAVPGAIHAANLPAALRAGLMPSLEVLVRRLQPEGLWLFGTWARGSASRRSDVDLPVNHGDAPFWRSVKAEAICGRHEQQIRPMDFIPLGGVEAGLQEWISPEDEGAFADP